LIFQLPYYVVCFRQGRARANDAQFVLIAEEGSGIIIRDFINKKREELMQQAIQQVTSMKPGEFFEIRCQKQLKAQQEAKAEATAQEARANMVRAKRSGGIYTLQFVHDFYHSCSCDDVFAVTEVQMSPGANG
jgi:hypothetical protein